MTDIKEPINTTSDGTFLSVVCENPEKSVVGLKEACYIAPEWNLEPLSIWIIVSESQWWNIGILGSCPCCQLTIEFPGFSRLGSFRCQVRWSISVFNTWLRVAETTCFCDISGPEAVTTAKWRDAPGKRTVLFSDWRSVYRGWSTITVSQNGEFIARYC